MNTPSHYAPTGSTITPWELQKQMESSKNAFVDARRADAIKYAFRLKSDLLKDLKKARHCLDEAITVLQAKEDAEHAAAEAGTGIKADKLKSWIPANQPSPLGALGSWWPLCNVCGTKVDKLIFLRQDQDRVYFQATCHSRSKVESIDVQRWNHCITTGFPIPAVYFSALK